MDFKQYSIIYLHVHVNDRSTGTVFSSCFGDTSKEAPGSKSLYELNLDPSFTFTLYIPYKTGKSSIKSEIVKVLLPWGLVLTVPSQSARQKAKGVTGKIFRIGPKNRGSHIILMR